MSEISIEMATSEEVVLTDLVGPSFAAGACGTAGSGEPAGGGHRAGQKLLRVAETTDEDRRSMVRGVQLTMDVAQRPALAAVCRAPHLAPASRSDADVWSFIERHAQTFYHPSCTCGIGRVVDSQLRVFGIEGLRVVDASVMPSIIRGNTNAPVIAIAERAADLIRSRDVHRSGEAHTTLAPLGAPIFR